MFTTINQNHTLGLLAGALSSVFWTLTYVLVIHRGAKERTFGMPLVALAANLSWEVIFLCRTIAYDGADVRLAMILPWTLLDAAIVYQCFRHGRDDFAHPLVKRYFPAGLVVIIVGALVVLSSLIREFRDAIGWYTAFGQNLMMSVLFVAMFLRRGSAKGQSIPIAISKFLGTFFAFLLALFWSPATLHDHWATLMPAAYYPISPLLVTLYAGVFCFDLVYIALLYHGDRSARA
jgi:hypothetical protein